MNAVQLTIQAAQDREAAAKASKEAAVEMQKAIYAEARARVQGLIADFNRTPMELRTDGTAVTGIQHPMSSSFFSSGKEYTQLGKGLRFYLAWAGDGRSLCLMLSAVCRYASHYAKLSTGPVDLLRPKIRALEDSTAQFTLAEAETMAAHAGYLSPDNKDFRIMGHITLGGGFARAGVIYDEKENSDLIAKTPVEWMTAILSSLDIAPYVVFGAPKKGKGKK